MDSTAPAAIKDILFVGHEIKKCVFESFKQPKGGMGGYILAKADHYLKFPSKKIMLLNSACEIKAFIGDADNIQPETDDLVFLLNINLQIKYSRKSSKSTPSQIKRYEWYFKSHASIFLNYISSDILKDTRFRMFDRPFNAF